MMSAKPKEPAKRKKTKLVSENPPVSASVKPEAKPRKVRKQNNSVLLVDEHKDGKPTNMQPIPKLRNLLRIQLTKCDEQQTEKRILSTQLDTKKTVSKCDQQQTEKITLSTQLDAKKTVSKRDEQQKEKITLSTQLDTKKTVSKCDEQQKEKITLSTQLDAKKTVSKRDEQQTEKITLSTQLDTKKTVSKCDASNSLAGTEDCAKQQRPIPKPRNRPMLESKGLLFEQRIEADINMKVKLENGGTAGIAKPPNSTEKFRKRKLILQNKVAECSDIERSSFADKPISKVVHVSNKKKQIPKHTKTKANCKVPIVLLELMQKLDIANTKSETLDKDPNPLDGVEVDDGLQAKQGKVRPSMVREESKEIDRSKECKTTRKGHKIAVKSLNIADDTPKKIKKTIKNMNLKTNSVNETSDSKNPSGIPAKIQKISESSQEVNIAASPGIIKTNELLSKKNKQRKHFSRIDQVSVRRTSRRSKLRCVSKVRKSLRSIRCPHICGSALPSRKLNLSHRNLVDSVELLVPEEPTPINKSKADNKISSVNSEVEKGSNKFVGVHSSVSGGLYRCIEEAVRIGAKACGMFLKSQRQWTGKPLTEETIQKFKETVKKHNFPMDKLLPHGSYLINLGSANPEILEKSRNALIDELQRCELLGIKLYNFHPGSSCGEISVEKCLDNIGDSINLAHSKTHNVITVIENMCCQGNTVGGKLEELRGIINRVKDKSRIGVCIDTCHAFAAGYDVSTETGFKSFIKQFDEIIGSQYLRALHLNDSKGKLGCHLDRHENIGYGHIGINAFKFVMNEPKFNNIPMILETPKEHSQQEEIEILYNL